MDASRGTLLPSQNLLSVVVPVFNEAGNIRELLSRIRNALSPLGMRYEIIIVDDGSSDGTWEAILQASEAFDEVCGYRLSRNFGHQGALLAGLSLARGNAVVSLDGDLQHPPELIPKLVAAWQAGAKIVLTKRIDAEETSAFKRTTSRWFYRTFSALAETRIEPGSSDFRLLDRRALAELLRLQYGEPFLRGAVQLIGFRPVTIEFKAQDRFTGGSKYTFKKMLRLATQGLISHSAVPLRVGIWLGVGMGVISAALISYIAIEFFAGNTVPGWTSTIGLMSILFSVLFIVIGIIGMYLDDVHKLLKQRPHFIVAEGVGARLADDDEANSFVRLRAGTN